MNVFCLVAATALAAPPSPEGTIRVESVVVLGNTATPDWFVRSLVPLRAGEDATRQQIRAAHAGLTASPFFGPGCSVELVKDECHDEWIVLVHVEERPEAAYLWAAFQSMLSASADD